MTHAANTNDYQFSVITALILHIIALSVIFLSFHFSDSIPTSLPQGLNSKPIQAVAIMPQQIKQQTNNIEQQQLTEHKKQQQAQADLKAAAEKTLQQQQQAAAKLKAEQQAQQEKLAKLKEQQLQEQARLKKIADQKAAALKKQELQAQALAAKKAQQLAQQKRQAQLQKELQRQLQDQLTAEQKSMAASKLKQTNNIVAQYKGLIAQAVIVNRPPDTPPNITPLLLVKLTTSGNVISVELLKSSGNAALDQAAITAVYKASPLPVPKDASIFEQYFRQFTMTTTDSSTMT